MNRDPLVSLVASPFRHYINGGWETGATTGVSLNPSDLDEPAGDYVRADARQTDTALQAASGALPESPLGSARRHPHPPDAVGRAARAPPHELRRPPQPERPPPV